MSQKSELVPKRRFKEFENAGDWEQRKFKDLLDENDGIRRGPFGSALKKEIFVPKSDYVVYEQYNAINDDYITRYNITKEKFDELHKFELSAGDFIMSGAGTIGKISMVPEGIKKGVINQALIRFKINSYKTDSEYFLQYIRAEFMQKKLTNANPGSAMANLVPMSEVKNWEILIPTIEEQQKIGKLFQKLDDTITLHQRKLDKLNNIKQSYLYQMFPQNGQKVPTLRFAGFSGDWEERQLDDIADMFDNLRVPVKASDRSMGSIPYYGANGIQDYVDGFTHNGEFVLIAEDGANDLINYPVQYVKGKVWVNNHAHVVSGRNGELSNLFLLPCIKAMDISSILVGGGRAKLNGDILKKLNIKLPSFEEQNKIGQFFKQLDENIEVQEQELEKLKNLKEAYLNEMFV